ncbi:MAG TPA: hypothetical protein EYG71_01620 [Leucothrix sp.]|nr:hypothetical protein [Leucothrix sp.]
MKFRISAFTAFIIFSSSASANWFDGFKQASTFMSNVTSNNTIMLNQGNSLSEGNTSLDFGVALGAIEAQQQKRSTAITQQAVQKGLLR